MSFFDLSLIECAIRLLLGVGIGFCIGLTGVGGGILVLPALTLILGIDPIKAVGTTSLFAFLTKASATYHHARLKTIEWGTSLRFLVGAVPSNVLVSLWVSKQGANVAFQDNLKTFIVGVVFFSVLLLIFNSVRKASIAEGDRGVTLADRLNRHLPARNMLAVSLGVVVGALLGATSIGGGVLIVPILIILFDLTARKTVGSSIFISVVLTLVTSVIYSRGGEVDNVTAIIMAVGAIGGVYKGSKVSTAMPEIWLRGIVVSLVSIAATLMLVNPGH